MKERGSEVEGERETERRVKCEHVLLAWLHNSGFTLEVIDSLEAVSAAGKSYPQLHGRGRELARCGGGYK